MKKNGFTSAEMLSVPGMMLLVSYLLMFITNTLVIYLANLFFPHQVVLGTFSINPSWALFHSIGVLTLICTFAIPIAHWVEKIKGRNLTSREWMIKYFFINFIGIWLIARFSDQFGLGLSGWHIAAILAIILDMVQGVVMMQLEKMR